MSIISFTTGGAPIFRPWAALIVGAVAAVLVLIAIPVLDWLHVDDPTETFASHGICGLWGLLAIGLFPERDYLLDYTHGRSGLFVGGDWTLLAIQSVMAGCIIAWSVLVSTVLLVVSFHLLVRLRELGVSTLFALRNGVAAWKMTSILKSTLQFLSDFLQLPKFRSDCCP